MPSREPCRSHSFGACSYLLAARHVLCLILCGRSRVPSASWPVNPTERAVFVATPSRSGVSPAADEAVLQRPAAYPPAPAMLAISVLAPSKKRQ